MQLLLGPIYVRCCLFLCERMMLIQVSETLPQVANAPSPSKAADKATQKVLDACPIACDMTSHLRQQKHLFEWQHWLELFGK